MSTTPAAAPVRVLVVDDEPNIVDVISMALRYEGFEVESAGTGADAIAAVRRVGQPMREEQNSHARSGSLRRCRMTRAGTPAATT